MVKDHISIKIGVEMVSLKTDYANRHAPTGSLKCEVHELKDMS